MGPQAGQNKRLTRDKTVTKFVRMSSLDGRHEEYGPREMRPRFALRLHGTLTLVGSRAETGMPPGRFSVISKGKSPVEMQHESSVLYLSCGNWWLCPEAPGPGIPSCIVGGLSLMPLLPLWRESYLFSIKNS